VRQILGKPKEVTDLSKNPNGLQTAKGELWEYFENGHTRLAISFPSQAVNMDAWTWYLYKGDSERDAKVAMSLFPDANWKSETAKWVNPHNLPNECYFTDVSKGLSIEYDRTHEIITSIAVRDPSRKPATSNDEKPPRFCIESACSDGQLSAVIFKDKPLCAIPK
jgi:hypothetical protein